MGLALRGDHAAGTELSELLALLRDDSRPAFPGLRARGQRRIRRPTAEPARWDRVLVNRPRIFSSERHPDRRWQRRLGEEGITKVGIRRVGRHLNENFGPLYGLLNQRVWKPWEEVRHEVCGRLRRGNVVHDHALLHLRGFVAEEVAWVDGELWDQGGLWPMRVGRWGRRGWYVHPRSGLLTEAPPQAARRAARTSAATP